MIYLDNAATSWPKPDSVVEAMVHYMRSVGATAGRSGHRLANEAERLRFDAREALGELLGVSNPMRIVFALNATAALNLVMQGLLHPGAHVVTTAMEHNSVLRPLRALERRGVAISIAPCAADGTLDADILAGLIRPETRLIVANHASNVCGTVLPIRAIGELARERGIPFLVDAAQTAGAWPIDLERDRIDLLAFTGHKGLLGPTGTGGLAIRDGFELETVDLPPLVCGGTGSRSEWEEQPAFLPDKYEAGTPNVVGLTGLAAGVRHVLERGVERIRAHERVLTARLIAGLGALPGVSVLGTRDALLQTAAVSFHAEKQSPSELAHALDERYEIMCRPGLHCAPQAHRTLGTLPAGTVRFAPGPFTTPGDIDRALSAVAELVGAEQNA